MAKYKSGNITAAEAAIIKARVSTNTPAEIAATLGRSEKVVLKWIENNLPRSAVQAPRATEPPDKASAKRSLKRSLKWQYLREGLTSEEMRYFEEQYSSYVTQFKNDILPSEEDQLFNLINLDIAIARNRRDVVRLIAEINRLQDEYASLAGPDRSEEERDRSREINQTLGLLRQAESDRNSQYLKMSAELKGLQNDLKVTRNQRVQKIDNLKESFLDVIKKLQNEDYNAVVGTAAEFARRATERESERLSDWHEYEDGRLDQPILTSETALDEE